VRLEFLVVAMLLPILAAADSASVEFGGHTKTRILADSYPEDSAFNAVAGSSATSLEEELRLNLSVDKGAWSFDGAWQLYGGYGDRIALTRVLGDTGLPGTGHLPSDERRFLDLTDTITDDGKFAAVQRLDRFAVSYVKDNFVIRVGRQALTWGNGLIFTPMDIVNPFDPVAIDTEYKPGDDMIYAQYLFSNGNDIEIAEVFRRDPLTGKRGSSTSSTAAKYHGILGDAEYDLLIAKHYGDTTFGVGGNKSIGGAIVHGDVVWMDTAAGNKLQLVTNLSYSWVWGGKNVSGLIEYYFTGFGQPDGRYDLASLSQNSELLKRFSRGEAFTLGRNYLAGGIAIEMSPLWVLTPNLFTNLDDGSSLLQVVARYSLGEDAELLAALNLPLGSNGTEFGGIDAGVPGVYFSTNLSLFAQFAWYF